MLGLTGATFAIGVPFVNDWFPPERRGLALGVFGMGNIGTAISGFVTPWLAERATAGRSPFLVVAAALVVIGLAFLLIGRDAPGRQAATEPFLTRFLAAARLRATQELAVLYALTFGGFVAFGVYLPLYLREVYGLSTADAAARAAGFVVLATLARPVGGWLSDRWGGVPVLSGALGVVVLVRDRRLLRARDAARHRRLPRPWRPRSGSATARCSPWSAARCRPAWWAAPPVWSARPAGSAASCRRS